MKNWPWSATHHVPRGGMPRTIPMVLAVATLCAAPTWASAVDCDQELKDWARESFGLTAPTPQPLDMSRAPREILAEHYEGPVRWVSWLVRSDFQALQNWWDQTDRLADETQRFELTTNMLDAITERGLFLLPQAEAWRAQNPQSSAAQWTQWAALVGAAGKARGTQYVRDTDNEQMMLSRLRWKEAEALATALASKSEFHRAVVDALSTWMRFAHGQSAVGWAGLERLMQRYPTHWNTYTDAQNFAFKQWSGEKSEARLKLIQDRMKAARVSAKFEQSWLARLEVNRDQPRNLPTTLDERRYWEQRVQANGSLANLDGLLEVSYKMADWPEVIKTADRILRQDRRRDRAWQLRGLALSKLGEMDSAREAFLHASVLGDNWALGQLIEAHFRGGYGIKPGDHAAALDLCHLGAVLGNAAGAHCIGAAYTDGFAGHKVDHREALRWHLWAGRAEERNSSYDASILLARVVQNRSEDVRAATGFWKRDAARQKHPLAINQIKAQPDLALTCLKNHPLELAHPPEQTQGRWWGVFWWMVNALTR